jgi:hypothetical protein
MRIMMTDGVLESCHNENKIKTNKEMSKVLLQCIQLRGPWKYFQKMSGLRKQDGRWSVCLSSLSSSVFDTTSFSMSTRPSRLSQSQLFLHYTTHFLLLKLCTMPGIAKPRNPSIHHSGRGCLPLLKS